MTTILFEFFPELGTLQDANPYLTTRMVVDNQPSRVSVDSNPTRLIIDKTTQPLEINTGLGGPC